MNKVILVGRLCADPEVRQTPSGNMQCNFRIAVNRQYANKQTGEREADFVSCTAWMRTAEFVNKYFSKGRMIAVEGSLRNNDWTDRGGTKHYSMNVAVDKAEFCGEKSGRDGNHRSNAQITSASTDYKDFSEYEELLGEVDVLL